MVGRKGERPVSVPYKLFYRLGFTPWEDAEGIPDFVAELSALLEREESGDAPHGSALDLGCGSGIWSVLMAKRGWAVTGVDYSEKALDRARERVRSENDDVKLVRGDVTALRESGVGSGFRVVLDTGTFHGLGAEQRMAMGREVDAIAADDAAVFLLAWNPRWRGPFPRGVSHEEIRGAFPGWKLTDEGESSYPPPSFLRAEEHWYSLHRAG